MCYYQLKKLPNAFLKIYVACISVIIPFVRGLKKTLEQSDEDKGVHAMKSKMLESLQRRFNIKLMEEIDFLVLSTMLDP